MAARRIGEHLQGLQLLARLERTELLLSCRSLVAQLNDVDAAGQRRVGEFGQVTALTSSVGAEIQLRCSET